MPTFNIQLFEGRTVEQKRAFVEAITRVTCETLGCDPGSVDIDVAPSDDGSCSATGHRPTGTSGGALALLGLSLALRRRSRARS